MSEVNWTQLRQEYESGVSLRQLASRYNVSKTYIIERRNKEEWDRPQRPTTDRPLVLSQRVTNPSTRDVNAASRVSKALELRAQKLTYEEIAHRCGYNSASACRQAVQRELERVISQNVDELRREEEHILNCLHAEFWEMAMDKKNKGRLFAGDRILAIRERLARLRGLDAKLDGLPAGVTIVREYGVEVGKV